jgi:hypothetical protein
MAMTRLIRVVTPRVMTLAGFFAVKAVSRALACLSRLAVNSTVTKSFNPAHLISVFSALQEGVYIPPPLILTFYHLLFCKTSLSFPARTHFFRQNFLFPDHLQTVFRLASNI